MQPKKTAKPDFFLHTPPGIEPTISTNQTEDKTMLISLTLGVAALVAAGDSLGRGARIKSAGLFVFGVIELTVGLYFITAAVGNAA
jgi:hypothetical protein